MPITLDGTTGATVPAVSDSGNLTFTGTGNRITGDFSNATVASRVLFQTSTANAGTIISAIPNGTGTSSQLAVYNNSDPANSTSLVISSLSADVRIGTNNTGTGTALPMTFYITGSERMRIDTSGIVTGTAGNLMLVQGTAQATTSGTVIDFTGIPSWAKRITIMFSGVSTNGTSDIQLQLGDSGGFETSGYGGALLRSGPSTTATAQYPTTGFLLINDIAAADIHSGMATISLLGSNTWCGSSHISETGFTGIFSGSGAKTLSDTLTQIRITTVGGANTFDAGSINIQYE
jgi:hypothetical protein